MDYRSCFSAGKRQGNIVGDSMGARQCTGEVIIGLY